MVLPPKKKIEKYFITHHCSTRMFLFYGGVLLCSILPQDFIHHVPHTSLVDSPVLVDELMRDFFAKSTRISHVTYVICPIILNDSP
jgi:hypothetical protein